MEPLSKLALVKSKFSSFGKFIKNVLTTTPAKLKKGLEVTKNVLWPIIGMITSAAMKLTNTAYQHAKIAAKACMFAPKECFVSIVMFQSFYCGRKNGGVMTSVCKYFKKATCQLLHSSAELILPVGGKLAASLLCSALDLDTMPMEVNGGHTTRVTHKTIETIERDAATPEVIAAFDHSLEDFMEVCEGHDAGPERDSCFAAGEELRRDTERFGLAKMIMRQH
eukprot:5265-Heterococcus_DN1.PRE.9